MHLATVSAQFKTSAQLHKHRKVSYRQIRQTTHTKTMTEKETNTGDKTVYSQPCTDALHVLVDVRPAVDDVGLLGQGDAWVAFKLPVSLRQTT